MPFQQVRDDVTLFYTDEGTGSVPLMFVHGWTCDSHDWSWQLEHFARDNRVIAADNRGHGASSVTPNGYEPATFAEDLALLLRALDVPKVVAIGHSLGGLIVAALAAEHPELVAGLVAVEPAYGFGPEDAAQMIGLGEAMTSANAHELTAGVLGFADGTYASDFARALHRRRMLATPAHVVAEAYRTNWLGPKQFGTRDRTDAVLDRVSCPTLTIFSAGHEDHAKWAAKRVRSELDDSIYLPLGHWPQQDVPDLVNSLIETWLKRLS